jgi:hypothetical protein
MKHPSVLLFIGTLLVTGISCQRPQAEVDSAYWMDQETARDIQYATSATAYHILPDQAGTGTANGQFMDYPVLSGPVVLGSEEIRQLSSLLSDTSSYHLDDAFKMCLFTPNVGIQLEREGQAPLTVLLCFDCNVLKIYDKGQEVFSEDFDPARTELLTIFYPIFKDMPYFRSLKST